MERSSYRRLSPPSSVRDAAFARSRPPCRDRLSHLSFGHCEARYGGSPGPREPRARHLRVDHGSSTWPRSRRTLSGRLRREAPESEAELAPGASTTWKDTDSSVGPTFPMNSAYEPAAAPDKWTFSGFAVSLAEKAATSQAFALNWSKVQLARARNTSTSLVTNVQSAVTSSLPAWVVVKGTRTAKPTPKLVAPCDTTAGGGSVVGGGGVGGHPGPAGFLPQSFPLPPQANSPATITRPPAIVRPRPCPNSFVFIIFSPPCRAAESPTTSRRHESPHRCSVRVDCSSFHSKARAGRARHRLDQNRASW